MKKENIFMKIINKIKRVFNNQKLLSEEPSKVVDNKIEPIEKVKISNLELEEMQYELENGLITEDELDDNQKEQLKELYNTQIRELEADINYIKYENSKNKK